MYNWPSNAELSTMSVAARKRLGETAMDYARPWIRWSLALGVSPSHFVSLIESERAAMPSRSKNAFAWAAEIMPVLAPKMVRARTNGNGLTAK